MTVKTTVQVDDRDLQEALSRLAGLGEDPGDLLRALGDDLVDKVKLGFVTSTDPYGIPWAPPVLRPGGKPLVDGGHLRDSISASVSGDTLTVGTNYGPLPSGGTIAGVHQFGATIEPKAGEFLVFAGGDGFLVMKRKVTIPARRIFPLDGLPPQWTTDLLADMRAQVEAKWGGGGSAGGASRDARGRFIRRP